MSEHKTMAQYLRGREVRVTILSDLYKKGYTYRAMQREVKARMGLEHYSLSTLKKDVDTMLKEWRQTRVETLDDNLTLELARIDKMLSELWTAWEKSKSPKEQKRKRQTGRPGGQGGQEDIVPLGLEQTLTEESQNGDPRYMELINRVLQERRKLLGLYKEPEQSINITGSVKPVIVFKDTSNAE